jgi:hypothetical protein
LFVVDKGVVLPSPQNDRGVLGVVYQIGDRLRMANDSMRDGKRELTGPVGNDNEYAPKTGEICWESRIYAWD